ncbi:MAG: hypothetical protein ABIH11_02705 [Candidatus Altiarchaeota archaeon]
MINLLRDNSSCRYRVNNRCSNSQIASSPIVDDSLQSRWYCSNCEHYSASTQAGVE